MYVNLMSVRTSILYQIILCFFSVFKTDYINYKKEQGAYEFHVTCTEHNENQLFVCISYVLFDFQNNTRQFICIHISQTGMRLQCT